MWSRYNSFDDAAIVDRLDHDTLVVVITSASDNTRGFAFVLTVGLKLGWIRDEFLNEVK